MSFWRIGGGSVRGPAHERTGKPNQDAILWQPSAGQGSRVVGAVADGHGASPHFRSDVGSRLAVEAVTEMIAWDLDDGEINDFDESLAGEIVQAWRQRVDAHLAETPYDPPVPHGYTPYGATLLALGANETQMLVLQVGDGDLLVGFPDGRLERPLQADEGLVGEQTYSLCMSDAAQRFRLATFWKTADRPLPSFVSLSTDGVAKSFRDDGAFEEAIVALRKLASENWDRTLAALPGWLSDVTSRGSGDDATLCLAVRTDTVQT